MPAPLLQDLVTILLGSLAFLSLLALWRSMLRRAQRAERLALASPYRDTLRARALGQPRRHARMRQPQADTLRVWLRRLAGHVRLFGDGQARRVRETLAQAGWREREAVALYALVKLVVPVGALATTLFLVVTANPLPLPGLLRYLPALAAGLAGSFLVDIVVKRRIRGRQRKLQQALPDMLDLLVICAEAGLGFDGAVQRIALEFERSAPEMADELTMLEAELTFLPDRAEALRNLTKRTGLASIGSVVTTILQGERYGTPLAQSLRMLAAEFRTERLLAAEHKAARLPAVMTVPLICFILPALFIVVIGPAVLDVMASFAEMAR
jgi:tight adherence protein C